MSSHEKTQEGTVEAITGLLGTPDTPEASEGLEAPKRKPGRPKGSKTKIRNTSASIAPRGTAYKEYEGNQEAYYKVVTKDDEVWFTDGYQALVAYEQTKGGALYCGRKTSLMTRVR